MFQLCSNCIILVGWFFNLFSSMNNLICSISCISKQISRALNIFYDDLEVYFDVCIKVVLWYIIYIINVYICKYINYAYVCMLLYLEIEKIYSNYANFYLNIKIDISIFSKKKFKKLIWFENWDLSLEIFF
jgi:hypothetical protein